MVLIFPDNEELCEIGCLPRSYCLCLTMDLNPRPSNFDAQTPCITQTFMCLLFTTFHQLLGKVGSEGKRLLVLFIFILCYLLQINSAEKVK